MKPGQRAIVPHMREMPPTRGHDLKRGVEIPDIILHEMPPTRGHDLKHPCLEWRRDRERMPPTRGHDLKLLRFRIS